VIIFLWFRMCVSEISRLSRSWYMKYRLPDIGVAVSDVTRQHFTYNVWNYFVDSNGRFLAVCISLLRSNSIRVSTSPSFYAPPLFDWRTASFFSVACFERLIDTKEQKRKNVIMSTLISDVFYHRSPSSMNWIWSVARTNISVVEKIAFFYYFLFFTIAL